MELWFGTGLLAWYAQNKRDLPWRRVQDPYKIWLSEIILQQTQVAQGLNYYLKFVERFPKVQLLAKAPEDEVLKLWQGLGYYSRARNLHFTAKTIVSEFSGKFPNDFKCIKSLKGIGDYTAAAIASFAYNLPHAVVDGNVYRVLSRVFGIEVPIDTGLGKREYQALADQLLDKKQAALYNQAIMEFGSQHCRPINPDCDNCIFRKKCSALKSGKVSVLPIKSKKTAVRKRFFNYLVIGDKKNNILLSKRSAGDIWKGLYEFPLIECSEDLNRTQFLKSKSLKELLLTDFTLLHVSKQYKHVLTHQHLYARFYVIKHSKTINGNWQKIPLSQLLDYALPRLIEKFTDDCDLKEIL